MKILASIALLLSVALAHSQCAIQIFIVPPPSTAISSEKQVGQIVQHAGESSQFTNLVFLANGTTNWTSSYSFGMGLHQFRCFATNQFGLVSAPGPSVQTNVLWTPTSFATVIIDGVTRTNMTVTIPIQ